MDQKMEIPIPIDEELTEDLTEDLLRPHALIDLHCDTITDSKYTNTGEKDSLDDPGRVLSLSAIPKDVHWAQFYAVFIPDEIRGQDAIDYFDLHKDSFDRQMEKFMTRVAPCRTYDHMQEAWALDKTAAFLTIENGSALAGDLKRVKVLADQGVKAMTLVWNGENEIGSGHKTSHGLSDFGKQVIPEMEKHKILVDVSHLNDRGFADLLEVAQKPFMATHSNARQVCNHKRNLTDQMILEMVKRDCLIGLNYYVKFIVEDGEVESLDDLYRHVAHFIELGAEKNLALGSDFDGAELPDWLKTPTDASNLYKYFIDRGLTQEQAEGILYKNAENFFQKNL